MSSPAPSSPKPKFTQRIIRAFAVGATLSVPLAAIASNTPALGISAVGAATMAMSAAFGIEFSTDIAAQASGS